MTGTLGSGLAGSACGSASGKEFFRVGMRLEKRVVSVDRALRVSVLAGGRRGDCVVCCRACVRSLAAATMRSVAEDVGI